jgi:hypothetical protein
MDTMGLKSSVFPSNSKGIEGRSLEWPFLEKEGRVPRMPLGDIGRMGIHGCPIGGMRYPGCDWWAASEGQTPSFLWKEEERSI